MNYTWRGLLTGISAFSLAFGCGLAGAATSGIVKSPAADTAAARAFNSARNTELPSDIVSIAPGLLAIVDHVSGWVLLTDKNGTERDRRLLPPSFRVDNIRTFPDRHVLIDLDGKRKIVLPRYAQPTGSIPEFLAVDVRTNEPDPDVAAPQFIKREHRRAGVLPQSGAGFSGELKVRGLTPGYLASASYLGLDDQGRAYTLAREIEINEATDETKVLRSKIHVTLTIGRHDRSGERIEVAAVPIADLGKIPRGQYVAIEPDGSAVVLSTARKSLHLLRPVFKPDTSREPTRPLAAAERTRRTIADASDAAVSAQIQKDDGAAEIADVKDVPSENDPEPISGRRSIARMKQEARKILSLEWQVAPANLGFHRQNACSSENPIELPYHLKRAKGSEPIVGVPYNWGGKASFERIKSDIARGQQAGNVCSETREVVPNTTGLDCSGFVGQVWGVQEFSTHRVHRISTPQPRLNQLRWGDVFNQPGGHILLYVGQTVSPEHGMRIRTNESAKACGGTCELSYHVEHLHGYEVRRLKAR